MEAPLELWQSNSHQHTEVLMPRFIVILTLFSTLAGCMTVGTKFNPALVAELTPKVSTIQDATELLGPPTSQTAMGNGTTLYQWNYSQGTALGTGSGAHVAMLFDGADTMMGVQHQSQTKIR